MVGVPGVAAAWTSSQMKISVVCVASSTTITQGSYPTSYTATQVVSVNDIGGTTWFRVAAISSSNAACPITSVTPSIASLTATYDNGVNGWVVTPTSKSTDFLYNFDLTFSADGGSSLTVSGLSLDVGCSQASFTD